jgi:hypothetical protein
MGQSVQIIGKRQLRPGVLRIEVDRSLTSSAHESYSDPSALARLGSPTPAATLAARLFATGNVGAVHVFSNIVTVQLTGEASEDELEEEVRNLFIHYRPGVLPTVVS